MKMRDIFHIKRIRWVAMVALISLVLVPAIAVLAGAANRYTEQVRTAGLAHALQSGIAREEATMAGAAQSIAGDIVARGLEGVTSTDAILPVLEADQKNTSATGVVFVGDNGVVVARTHAPQEWGDYIYETTAYGRVMAQGHDFASVETGSIYLLVINAGHVIMNASGTPIAGVIAGRWFDDNYVQGMRDAYFGTGGDQLVVYSNQFGEVGSSFSSAADRAQAARLFNAGSDLVRGNIGDTIVPVTVGGVEYIARRVLFDGVGKSNGGAFILVPYSYVGSAVVLSALLVAIVWLILFARLSYRQPFFSKVVDGILLGIGAMIVFFVSFHANVLTFEYETPVISQSGGAMYNSVLSVYPSASIFDSSFGKFVSVQLSSGGESINAIRVHMQFNQHIVSVDKLDTSGTLCEKGVVLDSVIDNANGTILFSCVIPGGYQGPGGVLVRALLRPVSTGDASLSFMPDSEVLANDGLGTNVLRLASGGNYLVGNGDNPLRLLVFSSSHPNENQWYASRNAVFSWNAVPTKSVAYRYALDQNPADEFIQSDAVATTTKLSVRISAPADGEWYFHVAAITGMTVGPVTTLPIRVDTTPPRQPVVLLSDATVAVGDTVRLAFSSSDDMSGLQKNFYVSIDNQPAFLPAVSPLFIPFADAGQHAVTVRAIDNAGNVSDATVFITVKPTSWLKHIMTQLF